MIQAQVSNHYEFKKKRVIQTYGLNLNKKSTSNDFKTDYMLI